MSKKMRRNDEKVWGADAEKGDMLAPDKVSQRKTGSGQAYERWVFAAMLTGDGMAVNGGERERERNSH